VSIDPKTGKTNVTGTATIGFDKPTAKQLPSNSKISPELHDEVVRANQENVDNGKAHIEKTIDKMNETIDKMTEKLKP
jgi:hypothetical protein